MITVYTTPGCIQCTLTKKALDKAGHTYTEINIGQDATAADLLRAAGHQALPVVDAGTAGTWTGFQPDKLRDLAGHITPRHNPDRIYTFR